jgi:hypothetical protein
MSFRAVDEIAVWHGPRVTIPGRLLIVLHLGRIAGAQYSCVAARPDSTLPTQEPGFANTNEWGLGFYRVFYKR